MAASMLAHDPLDRLTHDQHLALLRCLCDAALDSEKMRGVLQREAPLRPPYCFRAFYALLAVAVSRRAAFLQGRGARCSHAQLQETALHGACRLCACGLQGGRTRRLT